MSDVPLGVGSLMGSLVPPDTAPTPAPNATAQSLLAGGQVGVGARQTAAAKHLERSLTQPEVPLVAPTRTSAIAEAPDYSSAAQALTNSNDFATVAHGGWAMEQYANQLPDVADGQAGAAMHDFARADAALDSGVVSPTSDFAKIWQQFTEGELSADIMNPATATSPKTQALLAGVQALADATNDVAAPDLTIGLTGRVSHVNLTPDGAAQVLISDRTVGWATAAPADAAERNKRWASMNVRPGLDRFKNILNYLYEKGHDAPKSSGDLSADLHDMFFGVSTDSDHGMLLGSSLGQTNAALLSAAVGDVAKSRNTTPEDVTGVATDAWRMLKAKHTPDPTKYDPFRLDEIINGEQTGVENNALNAVQGHPTAELADALASQPTSLPYVLGKVSTLGLNVLADGTLGVRLEALTPKSAGLVRHLAPGIGTQDGLLLRPKAPRTTLDAVALVKSVDQATSGHRTEMWAFDDFPAGHPALLPGIHIGVEHGDKWSLSRDIGTSRLQPASPALVTEPKLSSRAIPPEELTFKALADPSASPLVTNAWGLIGAKAGVRARLQDLGYSVKEVENRQEFLVFGIDPKTLTKLGKEFGQESVMSNDRLWYTGGKHEGMSHPVNPDNISLAEKTASSGYHLKAADSGSVLGGASRDFVFNPDVDHATLEHVEPTTSSNRVPRRQNISYVTLQPEQFGDIPQIVDQIESSGAAKVTGVYAPGSPPDGWTQAHESVHQDGANVAVVRTADKGLAARHGAKVWVRDTAGLPQADPEGQRVRQVATIRNLGDGSRVVDNLVIVRPAPGAVPGKAGLLDYRLDGKKASHIGFIPAGGASPLPTLAPMFAADPTALSAEVKGDTLHIAADPADLTPVVQFVDTLGDAGFDLTKVRVSVGKDALHSDF